ncbi:MAG: 1,6-anhydro-N-acetylmuramyl-L-alanine amidase AmpD [Gammaproteobacteria bacterium]|nr:1,6-anhydro-N-acetylmuramyl-L-alanine amidase AmpD [Gammaproteobacteria bacterium]
MQIIDHLLPEAAYKITANQDQRSQASDISLIVIHGISLPAGHFGGPYIEQLFTNQLDCKRNSDFRDLEGLQVSAHLLIRRKGEITQFVAFNHRAWHAGSSSYGGRTDCNDFSIGIELEGVDYCDYGQAQYQQLARICRLLLHEYTLLSPDRIVGHSDVAPGRKTDPGDHFDWARFRSLLGRKTT